MSPDRPVVSIFMATYNNAAFISQAIESVLSQSMGDFELIVSDNASSDNTEDIARRYASQDPRVRYFRNSSNVGLSGNFNLCYRRSQAESKYFIGLPSDDWWEPDMLERLVDIAERHPDVAIVHGNVYRTDSEGNVIDTYLQMLTKKLPPEGIHQAVKELYEHNYIPFQAALVSRRKFRLLSPFEQPYDEEIPHTNDYFLWLTLFTRGAKAYFIPEPLAYFRKHEGSFTMPSRILPRLRQEVLAFEKLEAVCPLDLEPDRRRAHANRLAMLAFELIQANQGKESRPVIKDALSISPAGRLDLKVARLIAALPVPGRIHAQLWRTALRASRLARGV